MTTYSEWEQSAAAREGMSCQDCHMSRTRAEVVDPRVQRVPDAEVNLHEVPGGHSISQLNKALAVRLQPKHEGEDLLLDVGLTNVGAGHAVPTGMPGRRVVLELKVRTDDGQTFEERRTYGRAFVDAAGAPIERDSGYFARGVSPVSDSRIGSREERLEAFRFAIGRRTTAFVTLRLHYENRPTGTEEGRTWITFYTTERVVGPATRSGG
jgi:hypothetical protein